MTVHAQKTAPCRIRRMLWQDLGLGENPTVLQPPIDCPVMRPYPSMHLLVLGRVAAVVGALYFVRVLDVPVVGLGLLARL